MNTSQAATPIDHLDSVAVKFLERNFNQCFKQMRQYNTQIHKMTKFEFFTYSASFGVVLGLYKYSIKEGIKSDTSLIIDLEIALMLGLFLFSLIVLNRVYFVRIVRYINRHWFFFLKRFPLSFQNATKIYADLAHPPFFDYRSSRVWFRYFIADLKSTIPGLLIFPMVESSERAIFINANFVILFASQLIFGIQYLQKKEEDISNQH